MPIFRLANQVAFPPVQLAEEDGFLAIGGELSPMRILHAYRSGIFPWGEMEGEVTWWAPPVRCLLPLDGLKVSKSWRSKIKRFTFSLNTCFDRVINQCADCGMRKIEGTWISENFKRAYLQLHEKGFAHSVEVWEKDQLVGGLYGVAIGGYFSGESMFHVLNDASKVALYHLVETLRERRFQMLDCQLPTDHLISLGALKIDREDYMLKLKRALTASEVRSLS